MEKKIVVQIPRHITILVQKYEIEYRSRQEIIQYILSNNLKIENEQFIQYQKDYDEKYFAFNCFKNEIENEYVMPIVKDKSKELKYSWLLDYGTSEITITFIKDEKT